MTARRRLTCAGLGVASWGVLGVMLLFTQAILRLGARAFDAYCMGLSALQLTVAALWIAFSAYAEGYRAFQLRFSPRVVVRALSLTRRSSSLDRILAPAYCMGLMRALPRTQLLAWSTLAMVVFFIGVLQHVPQPWRGIVDAGVVVALAWGALAMLGFYIRALSSGHIPRVSAGLPVRSSVNRS